MQAMGGRLQGRVALVTGAARGIGRASALRLAGEGADVIAIDICGQLENVPYPLGTRDDLELTEREILDLGARVVAAAADVRDVQAITAAVAEGTQAFGRLDFVVASAGVSAMCVDEAPGAWEDVIGVNLTGCFNTVEAALSAIIRGGQGGAIVLVNSTAGLAGICGPSNAGMAYVASKHGVVGLMRSYANNLARHRIRVNTVHPTGVDTPMVANAAFEAFTGGGSPLTNALPVGRLAPDDIADAIAWLVSDDAKFVTGVTLPVDAGFLVNRQAALARSG